MKPIHIYGLHAVTSLLQNQPQRIVRLWVVQGRQDQRMQAILLQAQAAGIAVEYVQREKLDRDTQSAVHQGILAVCAAARAYTENDLSELLATANKKK